MRPNISLGDSLAGLHAAFGTVMALLHRSRLGAGAAGQVSGCSSLHGSVAARALTLQRCKALAGGPGPLQAGQALTSWSRNGASMMRTRFWLRQMLCRCLPKP